jgi:hypothetical protein
MIHDMRFSNNPESAAEAKNQGFSVTTLRTNEIRATVQWLICKAGYAPVLI